MRRLRFILTGVGVAALCAALVVGCGGDDDSEGEMTQETTSAQQQSGRQQGGDSGGPDNQGGQQQGDGGGQQDTTITDVNPDGTSEPTPSQLGIERGADNSLQTYGADAEGDERSDVVAAMSGFFSAMAQGIEEACPYFTSDYLESLRQLTAQQGGQPSGDGCTSLARFIAASSPPGALAAEARKGLNSRVLRVGIKDDRAIIMLRQQNDRLAYFTMTNEDGEWKTSSLSIVALPPR